MRNGQDVHPGAAACDWSYLPENTQFRIVGIDTIFTCEDTGNAVIGWTIDIWVLYGSQGKELLRKVGTSITIEIVVLTPV
ncbi:MAG: hypothetical protein A2Y57_04515 [Candidatus Woykebacteria bacterium RBG_13_40_7b]|uniref:3D domain-containing protein n=1 Tax=Candidatus Woykebacteria bacterium RBG_13_40_7b TaxID=1802594 RepID=A0A1G1W807_9BACT|nr:MAG: hypothetical protein A2Y57_04515 [Candidatus Woykebacteria bacterium RBG_13_40_7b]